MARAKRVSEPQAQGLEYHFEKVVRSKQCYELDTRLVSLINQFPLYVKTVRDVQPTPDEVIERALFEVFHCHVEFRAWLEQTGNQRGRQTGPQKSAKETSKEAEQTAAA